MATCSIVIPVHNEASNIESFIKQFIAGLGELSPKIIEIQLIENGSTDNTFQVCQGLAHDFPQLVRARRIPFASYGEAIKQGILSAVSRDMISILECDVLDVNFLAISINMIEAGQGDFVVGSKRHPDSLDRRPFKRRLLTCLFNIYLKFMLHSPVNDTHGLKTIRAPLAKRVCQLAVTGGEVLQTEIVLIADKLGYSVVEAPVHVGEKRKSPVPIISRIPKVMKIVFSLNFNFI